MIKQIKFQAFGGQLLGVGSPSILYLADQAMLPSPLLRGGQHVIFPQFADSGPLNKHGFARNLTWIVLAEERTDDRHYIKLRRNISRNEISMWPYDVELTLDVEYSSGLIRQTFEVTNIGSDSFSWTGGLHPYFSVEDVCKAYLYGLNGVRYKNRYAGDMDAYGADQLTWDEDPCEKIFATAPDLVLMTSSCQIELSTTGFDQWMVWNPGRYGAREIRDLPDADWNRFVCVEPVCIERPVKLDPGQAFLGTFEIRFGAKGVSSVA